MSILNIELMKIYCYNIFVKFGALLRFGIFEVELQKVLLGLLKMQGQENGLILRAMHIE